MVTNCVSSVQDSGCTPSYCSSLVLGTHTLSVCDVRTVLGEKNTQLVHISFPKEHVIPAVPVQRRRVTANTEVITSYLYRIKSF